MQEEKIKNRIKIIDSGNVCPVCKRKPYSPKHVSIGVCKSCRSIIGDDIHVLYRCAEDVAASYGYLTNEIYKNSREEEVVSARRLIATTCTHLSNAPSGMIATIMRSRGKDMHDSSVRHHILVSRDLYTVSKSYRELIDRFMLDTLDKYLSTDNKLRRHHREVSDIVAGILVHEGLCSEERSFLIAEKIMNAIELG